MITFTLDIYMITVFIYTIIFVYAYNLMQFSMYNPSVFSFLNAESGITLTNFAFADKYLLI